MKSDDKTRRRAYNAVMYRALLQAIAQYDAFATPDERNVSEEMGRRRDVLDDGVERDRLLEELRYLQARLDAREQAASANGEVRNARLRDVEHWIAQCRRVRAAMDESAWV